jgi:hypothetical protein
MKELQDSLAIILGEHPLSYYLAGFFFSALAILLSFYHNSTKREKPARTPRSNSPGSFSFAIT